jgi:hypothetical protein
MILLLQTIVDVNDPRIDGKQVFTCEYGISHNNVV